MYDHSALVARRETIRQFMDESGSRFLSVDFVKKDGTLRNMNCQLAAGRALLAGDAASDSAKQAVETRKANNPNLRNVYSVTDKAWRSINLDTVLRISRNGQIVDFGPVVSPG